ncbi:glycosyltransferase family 8 protein [Bacteroidales bacterium]|nr:glycosyltransferase family 8 protein [Bacteroidales bacterium]
MNINNSCIHLAFAINDKFTLPLATLLESIFATNKNNQLSIHVFAENLVPKNKNKIESIVKQYNATFNYHNITIDDFSGIKIYDRFSLAAYYRLIMPSKLEQHTDKFLYLDADIIVNGDLTPLWNTDLEKYAFAATDDLVAIECKRYDRFNIPRNYSYFNSGVLLINIKNWISNDITQKAIEYLRNNECPFVDQDALNAVAYELRLPLPPIWNQQIGLYFVKKEFITSVYAEADYAEAIKKPIIIHFNGKEKPWHCVSWHPHQRKFNQYRKTTGLTWEWDNKSLKKRIKNLAYRIIGWKRICRYDYYKNGRV